LQIIEPDFIEEKENEGKIFGLEEPTIENKAIDYIKSNRQSKSLREKQLKLKSSYALT